LFVFRVWVTNLTKKPMRTPVGRCTITPLSCQAKKAAAAGSNNEDAHSGE
jgi:hypothetical protein